DIDSRIFKCTGSLDLDEGRVTCPHPHGEISFKEALAKSCNLTFAEISLMLGRDTLQKYVDKLGFNSTITVNDIKTSPGKIFLKDLNDLNLAWAGIGQSKNMINPINFLSFMGAVANDGKRINPRILKKNTAVQGLTILSPENKRIMSESTAAELKTMMRYNVTEAYGDKNFRDLNLCAKTGTAEVSENGKPHAWFAGFMDREDCPLAFIVIVENSGSGIGIAAPVANKVLQAALKNR
ncbi:MAG TPA: penicillin-binding transpeptidase domain-containing protein, partial [Anaerovoracaceae bacterium]|nr:penicillin-binding transpeptidase domain-containing protein [Anaerovoracaceae bacterium]